MPSYFQILTAIISFAVANPQAFKSLWDKVVSAYQATLDLINGVKAELPGVVLPGDGVLGIEGVADAATCDAEGRLQSLIQGDSQALSLGSLSNLRKIITWLRTSEVGSVLLNELLKRLGS